MENVSLLELFTITNKSYYTQYFEHKVKLSLYKFKLYSCTNNI